MAKNSARFLRRDRKHWLSSVRRTTRAGVHLASPILGFGYRWIAGIPGCGIHARVCARRKAGNSRSVRFAHPRWLARHSTRPRNGSGKPAGVAGLMCMWIPGRYLQNRAGISPGLPAQYGRARRVIPTQNSTELCTGSPRSSRPDLPGTR